MEIYLKYLDTDKMRGEVETFLFPVLHWAWPIVQCNNVIIWQMANPFAKKYRSGSRKMADNSSWFLFPTFQIIFWQKFRPLLTCLQTFSRNDGRTGGKREQKGDKDVPSQSHNGQSPTGESFQEKVDFYLEKCILSEKGIWIVTDLTQKVISYLNNLALRCLLENLIMKIR